MDDNIVWQLYPLPAQEQELTGLYLRHNLRQYGEQLGRAYIYSNYVTSLDGRIAIPRPGGERGMMVPPATANDRDWRLFQELAVQADLIISSGRYLRDYAEGRAQEILRVHEDPRFADLHTWRLDQGLPLQPDLAVVSGSLDFPVPETLIGSDRRVIVITSGQADPDRVRELEAQGATVIAAGEETVEGDRMAQALTALGYRTVYMATGPQVHQLLLAGGAIDRLFLTFAHRLLGGRPFSSVVEGDLLDPATDLHLDALYYDPHGLDGLGQLFIAYTR